MDKHGAALAPNVFLIGLMGAGKTTIGRALARKLEWSFVDSDHEIQQRTGVSIPTIFEIEGEAGFRRREVAVIEEICQRRAAVVATGGGVVLAADNRRRLRQSGLVAYLDAPPALLFERTRHDRNRPLLQVPNPLGRLEELRAERDPLYRETAHLVIDAQRLSQHQIVSLLENEVSSRCAPLL